MQDERRSDSAEQPIELVADTIGQMMEYWGFKHIMGRLWTFLFLSPKPLSAPELAERLHASAGSISMALADLQEWGAIYRVCPPESRKDHFVAESNIWKLVSRILTQREAKRIDAALDHLEKASSELRSIKKRRGPHADTSREESLAFQIHRVDELRKLGALASEILQLVVLKSRVDVTPVRRLFENRKRRSSAPIDESLSPRRVSP